MDKDGTKSGYDVDLIKAITDIHTFSRNTYGFEFSTQIGGLEQYNQISKNWVEFYREKRLFCIGPNPTTKI